MIKSFKGKTPVVPDSAFVADSALVIGDVVLGENVNVWYGAVIRADEGRIIIGDNTNVQDNCVVHCDEDLIIGKNVTIGHGAIVHGKKIGDDVMIGMGSISLVGSEIGDGSILGAGALLTQNKILPSRSVAIGSPAKVVRDVMDEDVLRTVNNSIHYVNLAKEHKNC